VKLLLDENLPHPMRLDLPGGHEVITAAYMNWSAIENGERSPPMDPFRFPAAPPLDTRPPVLLHYPR
jgi:hypothetical protein